MKFLCDRCKTRYSIGDDRVRGKILKIRCKTCANIVTVREGMPNPDAVDPGSAGAQPRVRRPTIAVPAVQAEDPALSPAVPAPAAPARVAAAPAAPARVAPAPAAPAPVAPAAPAPGGALGAAFASAMAKPPPALEEEWYVSIDGEQAGPYSLADAQRWVAAKPFDAELFCWSEGFDDWLPVDKVSHFRGLRKKPAPAPAPAPVPAPPPPLRSATSVARSGLARAGAEDTPKPLFAATMAQLEKGAAAPAPVAVPMPAPAAAPRPLDARGLAPGARPPGVSPNGAAPSVNGAPKAGATPFEAADPGESATLLEPLRFDLAGDAAATAKGLPSLDRSAAAASAPAPAPAPDLGPAPADPGDGDDDLDIGEVSRVVKLADLSRDAERRAGTAPPVALVAATRAAAAARLETVRPIEHAPGPFASSAGDAAALLAPEAAAPPVVVSHRRALFALIAGAIVLIGVAVAVVFFVLADDEETGGGSRLGKVEEIDTTRPDEVRPVGSGETANAEQPVNPLAPKPPRRPAIAPVGPTQGPTQTPEPGHDTAPRLEAREIEDMATRNSGVTQRCYMRAQRGAEGILIGDVKKIAVTLTISGEGVVTDAQLSDNHAQNSLGRCLIGTIKTWKFRSSPGGTFRFVLHFG